MIEIRRSWIVITFLATSPALAGAELTTDGLAPSSPPPGGAVGPHDLRIPPLGLPEDQPDAEWVPRTDHPVDGAPDDFSKPWPSWLHATGDWFGLRPAMEEHGLTVEAIYVADWFQNLRGGQNSADAGVYRGLFDLALLLDTEAAGLWKGGTLLVRFQNIHGRDITLEHVGDLQVLNNVDAPDRSQVAEYVFEQHLWDRRLHLKLGKMDANADFAWVQYGLEFIHSSPGFPPVIPMPSYPDPALGAVLRVEATDWLHLAGGVYDADGSGDRWGFDSALHGPDNSITLFEMAVRPVFRLADRELPGIYKVGGWYHSGEWLVLPTRPLSEDDARPERLDYRQGNSGVYFLADQLLYREPAPDGETGEPDPDPPVQGLGAFFQFAWAPSEHNELTQYYGGGMEYRGLISGRDDDVTGLGVFHVSLSGRIQSVEERYSETAIELFHLIQLTNSLSLKPDLQYIANPGGNGRDAIVVGLRMAIAF